MTARLVIVLLVVGFHLGCGSLFENEQPDRSRESGELQLVTGESDYPSGGTPLFTPWREEVGVQFRHYNAATMERRLPETMGSGVAFFDFNNDDYPDIYFPNGTPFGSDSGQERLGRLYRNLTNGRFEDVTPGSGLDESFFGLGVAVGDLENDGFLDLAVSGIDKVRIFRNLGDGKFRNVTKELGLDCRGYSTSLSFLDYDRDGFLDLFVNRYVQWTPETDIACTPDGVNRTYCTPEVYPPMTNCLFRNRGGKRFENKTKSAGLGDLPGKSSGVVVFDYNNDLWPDIAVANDTQGNFLLLNRGDGTFTDIGEESGMALSESGVAQGGNGIDAGDIDGDGLIDLVIGNFSQEMTSVLMGKPEGLFSDETAQLGTGIPSLMTLAFGTLVEDFNNDSWLDILLINGHIEPDIAITRQAQSYRQPPLFFRNTGQRKFEALDPNAIGLDDWLLVGRGFASGDYDLDGDLDFVVTQNGGPAYILENNLETSHWIRIKLIGTKSNRVGYGSAVRIFTESRVLYRYFVSSRSYLSASEPRLSVGLGDQDQIEKLEIDWPSGIRQVIDSPTVNSKIEIVEPAS